MDFPGRALRVLGALEERVMDVLWAYRGPLAVRDVWGRLDGEPLAYTTIMTTLDRLYKKGLLDREREGTAFLYRARISRDDLAGRIVEETVGALLAESEASADPVLAAFVDAAAAADEGNLARLEQLIAERRKGCR